MNWNVNPEYHFGYDYKQQTQRLEQSLLRRLWKLNADQRDRLFGDVNVLSAPIRLKSVVL